MTPAAAVAARAARTAALSPLPSALHGRIGLLGRIVPPRPAGTSIRHAERAVVARGELDPVAVIAQAEVEVGDDRVGEVFASAVAHRLMKLPPPFDFGTLAQRRKGLRRPAFVAAVVGDRD